MQVIEATTVVHASIERCKRMVELLAARNPLIERRAEAGDG